MIRETLANYEHPELMGLALFLFLFSFSVVTFFAYRKSAKKHYEKMAQLPLEKEF